MMKIFGRLITDYELYESWMQVFLNVFLVVWTIALGKTRTSAIKKHLW